jgi:hypothetical protein
VWLKAASRYEHLLYRSLYENLQITAQVINGIGVNLNETDGEKKRERGELITQRSWIN